ncbi:hypothetical protein MPTK1_4g00460 [Marchantia polymorpha subsp. ruderalis]|uniref:Uncharacterized protein n=2 Tax=Marchantia polymorpha TaxID=3197 RepID=A0AAF6B4V8_MARPO|nr:hypothetical protein MARPO_0066s0095 [Marchantia polymorpha]BBN07042.1 hypothetical protein Mp_4g00460 [Marchantia polymorpha subsp. ruderalis]|eukprot:PTQ36142.1 hypothetical protein MARPO_0066s0095 [Marchantia polymorpha]
MRETGDILMIVVGTVLLVLGISMGMYVYIYEFYTLEKKGKFSGSSKPEVTPGGLSILNSHTTRNSSIT